MPDHDIVVVGASAGGVEALVGLAASLPADLPAAVFVVLHVPPTGTSALPDILSRHCRLPASHAKDGEPIEPGRIYVAPPDHHVLVRTGHVHLTRGPREHGHRPAVDPLFRSAAREHATRVVGVVLSGAFDDGTAGLVAVKARGGVAVVQDPSDALYPGMPTSALEHAKVDHVLPAASIGALLARLASEPAQLPPGPAPTDIKVEVEGPRWTRWRASPRRALRILLSRLQRCPLGDPGRRPATVPLPGRPRLVAGEPPHPPERGPAGGPVDRPAQPGGAGRPGQTAGRAGPAPRPHHHCHPLRGAGHRDPAGRPGGPGAAGGGTDG